MSSSSNFQRYDDDYEYETNRLQIHNESIGDWHSVNTEAFSVSQNNCNYRNHIPAISPLVIHPTQCYNITSNFSKLCMTFTCRGNTEHKGCLESLTRCITAAWSSKGLLKASSSFIRKEEGVTWSLATGCCSPIADSVDKSGLADRSRHACLRGRGFVAADRQHANILTSGVDQLRRKTISGCIHLHLVVLVAHVWEEEGYFICASLLSSGLFLVEVACMYAPFFLPLVCVLFQEYNTRKLKLKSITFFRSVIVFPCPSGTTMTMSSSFNYATASPTIAGQFVVSW